MGNLIPFIDIETTGLNPRKDKILQVALIITDEAFKETARYDWVVKHNVNRMKRKADEYVLKMHEATGLWDRIASGEAKTLKTIDRELAVLLKFLRIENNGYPVEIAGNSVNFDKSFIQAQLKESGAELSHRVMDLSSVLGFFRKTGNKIELPKSDRTHNALEDIEDCVNQARAVLARIS